MLQIFVCTQIYNEIVEVHEARSLAGKYFSVDRCLFGRLKVETVT